MDSRCGVPSVPRKYFWATMFVAFCDQRDGELHVALLEGDAALLEVRDDGVARLPFDVVERVPPFGREVPLEGQSSRMTWTSPSFVATCAPFSCPSDLTDVEPVVDICG